MSTSDRAARALVMLGGVVIAALVVRCAPPDACLRHSDCGSGATCVEGSCREGALADAAADAPPEGAPAPSARSDASTPAEASTDAATDAPVEAGDDPADAAPDGSTDE
ncbi:MAG: hypothetical protein KF819_07110 [Labilithrix sp.]|nr:hypothetical protein [Labilithrix sp.]